MSDAVDQIFTARRLDSVEALVTHAEFHGKMADISNSPEQEEAHLEMSLAYEGAALFLKNHKGLTLPRLYV